MNAATQTLAEFLLERIAEDEEKAASAGPPDWEVADPRKVRWRNGAAHGWAAFVDIEPATIHIARWDPARVLAECEAKRDIVEMHYDINDGDCMVCVVPEWGYPSHGGSHPESWPCRTLRILALPYADHPDYREEWKP